METWLLIVFAALAVALLVVQEIRIRVLQKHALAVQQAVMQMADALPKMSTDMHYLHAGLLEARAELDLPGDWETGRPTRH